MTLKHETFNKKKLYDSKASNVRRSENTYRFHLSQDNLFESKE